MSLPPGLEFSCPRCRGALDATEVSFTCSACDRAYPVVVGIPDFRVAPDPWIDLEADRAKGIRLETETRGQGLAAMVRAYWAMTPETPDALARRYTSHVLEAESRSREWLDGFIPTNAAPAAGPWLDIGCGTADLAAAAWPRTEVVGIDVAFRWLVVARRRLEERGIPVRLVCCNAEALPFSDGAFDRVLSLGTLEHVASSRALLLESRRVLRGGGVLRFRTVNRYSVCAEPHVGVWGVGWLPRRWADGFVRWRTGHGYEHHTPLSARQLRRELRQAGFASIAVEAAPVLSSERARLSAALAPLVPVYEASRRLPLLAGALGWMAPLLEGRGVAA